MILNEFLRNLQNDCNPGIQYNTIQYNTIQYNTIQYNTIQYNTIIILNFLKYIYLITLKNMLNYISFLNKEMIIKIKYNYNLK